MARKSKIKIDIVSDVVCPWCYIGKRRLESAMKQVSDRYDFEIEYLPFELNPNTPQKGLNHREYLTDKFGGEERYEQITGNTTAVAAKEGLNFNFDIQKILPNTRALHVVIQFAKEEGKQVALMEKFFKAYFIEGIDLSKRENIINIAVSAGLDEKKTEKSLDDELLKSSVAFSEKEVSKLGITGVPFYIINNAFGISGAQMSETFIKAFEEIDAHATATAGEACDVDGKNC